MSRYRAVLFDLFDTVALLDRTVLPPFTFEGRTKRATTAALQGLYEQHVRDIPFLRFVAALREVAREQQAARAHDLREVPCTTRFERTLLRAGLDHSEATSQLAARLAGLHSSLIGGAATVPPGHARFLQRLSAVCPIALVSNFDDAGVARQVLERGGVRAAFRHVTISVDHGWRKPDPRIFLDTLRSLGVEPGEALFVGDSPDDDVQGAKLVGMEVAWVNASGAPFPAHLSAPDHMVTDVPSLASLLDVKA